MSRLKRGLLITPKDIQIITGCAISTARREHKLVRAILGKTKRRLTVKEYCNYFEFDYAEVVEYINPIAFFGMISETIRNDLFKKSLL